MEGFYSSFAIEVKQALSSDSITELHCREWSNVIYMSKGSSLHGPLYFQIKMDTPQPLVWKRVTWYKKYWKKHCWFKTSCAFVLAFL